MDISKYTSFFHDGSIMDIQHEGNNIILFMESAEVDPEELEDRISLSKNDTFSGKLHVENVKGIQIGGNYFIGKFEKKHDDGDVFHFKIKKNCLELEVIWQNFPPKEEMKIFSVIKIEAEKIYWENIPDLIDQFP